MFIVTAKQDIGLELHADQAHWVHADHTFPSHGHEAEAGEHDAPGFAAAGLTQDEGVGVLGGSSFPVSAHAHHQSPFLRVGQFDAV